MPSSFALSLAFSKIVSSGKLIPNVILFFMMLVENILQKLSIIFTKRLDNVANCSQHCCMKNKVKRKVQGISFEIAVLSAAKERARNRRQSLSAYINSLILPNVANNSQPQPKKGQVK